MIRAEFVSIEDDGNDLILSFAIGPHAERSLVFLRTPQFEGLFPPEERGISVSLNGDEEHDLLRAVKWGADIVIFRTDDRQYRVDITGIPAEEIEGAKLFLRKMDLTRSLEVEGG